MSLLVWLAFGVIALPIMVERINPAMIVYAVLSLTAIRMVPVALALIGSGLDRNTVLFVGWFGPRGLASLVFALLALEELGSGADEAVAVVAVTVLLSVIAHGLSATPLASKYGRSTAPQRHRDAAPHPEIALRGLPRQRGDATEPDQLH
jgi:NhaP-type Na+/H+ or K+/H+ antiporter